MFLSLDAIKWAVVWAARSGPRCTTMLYSVRPSYARSYKKIYIKIPSHFGFSNPHQNFEFLSQSDSIIFG